MEQIVIGTKTYGLKPPVFITATTYERGDELTFSVPHGSTMYYTDMGWGWTASLHKAKWFPTRADALEVCFSTDYERFRKLLVATPVNRWRIIEMRIAEHATAPSVNETDIMIQQNIRERLTDNELAYLSRHGCHLF